MQLTDKLPNSTLTVAQALSRGAWAYDQVIEGGSIDKRIDVAVSNLGELRKALAANDLAGAQAILDRIEVQLTVKPSA